MRYYEDKSITQKVKRHLRKMEDLLSARALTAQEMFLKEGNITVIPYEFALHWLDLFPALIKYNEARNQLTYFKLDLDPVERSRYEEQFLEMQHLETYLAHRHFPMIQDENPTMTVLRQACTDLTEVQQNELCVSASIFLPEIDTIREVEKRKRISLAQYDLSILEESNDLDLLNDVDNAERLIDEGSIIPLAIYCEFLHLATLLGAIQWLDETLAVCNTKTWRKTKAHTDLQNFSKDFQGKLNFWTIKHPFLAGKPHHDMDRLLLEYYTKPPDEIIQMIGPDVVCFPYHVPEEMKNSPFNPLLN